MSTNATDRIIFRINGNPVAQGRGRIIMYDQCYSCRRKAYKGKYKRCPACGAEMRTLAGIKDPDQSRHWKVDVKLMAQQYAQSPLWEETLMVDLTFEFQRPKSISKKATWKATKPDVDNLAKAITDALEGVIYRNDAQIAVAKIEKRYSESPGVTVSVMKIYGG